MKLILAAALIVAATPAFAQYGNGSRGSSNYGYGTGSNSNSNYVQPYSRSDGSSVGGHYRTNPNNTTSDNYGTRGNYNPYSGQAGRRGGSLY
ncbi:hypothetical protein [Bosea sp. 2RAB26]|uniref:hypothetical protein n=1 Tax=Bosea sp. 2RAB26 TaxID=3237476 RepID=UPI003F901A18